MLPFEVPTHFFFSFSIGSLQFSCFLASDFCAATDSLRHTHAEWELCYFSGGISSCTAADSKLVGTPGHYLILPPNTLHHVHSTSNGPKERHPYILRFSVHNLQSMPALEAFLQSPHLIRDKDLALDALFHALSALLRQDRTVFTLSAPEILKAMFIQILFHAVPASAPLFTDLAASQKNTTLCLMDQFFYHHFLEKCSIKDLAQHLNMTVTAASHLVSQQYGMCFTKKLQHMRLALAKDLLRTTDRQILDIALSSGFISSNSFYHVFSKAENCTPSQYRALFRSSSHGEDKP